MPDSTKVVPIVEKRPHLVASNQETQRYIVSGGGQPIAFDLNTTFTRLPPGTGNQPAPVLPITGPKTPENALQFSLDSSKQQRDEWSRPKRSERKAQEMKGSKTPETLATSATKASRVIALLSRPAGATLKEIMAETAWQAHSVRGFISGQLTKKMGLKVKSFKRDGERVYRILAQKGVRKAAQKEGKA